MKRFNEYWKVGHEMGNGDLGFYVRNVEVYGLNESIRRSKFPMAKNPYSCTTELTDGIRTLGATMGTSGHDNFLCGIVVQFDLTASNKFWVEFQRYHFADIISSQSTMHKISEMEIEHACNKYVSPIIVEEVERLKQEYLSDRTDENYLRLLYSVPSGFRLTAGITTNYRQLKTIYYQRRKHTLPEWREFCLWMKDLPLFEEIVLGKTEGITEGVE